MGKSRLARQAVCRPWLSLRSSWGTICLLLCSCALGCGPVRGGPEAASRPPGAIQTTPAKERALSEDARKEPAVAGPVPSAREAKGMAGVTLQQLYTRARGKVPYVPPSDAEGAELAALSGQLLGQLRQGAPDQTVADSLAALGLELVPVEGGFLALRERAEARRGWGCYLFRLGPLATEVILQAPHTFFDEGSGPLALALFAHYPVRALFFNTVHRGSAGAEDEGSAPTDVAHNPLHPFQRMTEGLREVSPLLLIQLHGFSEGSAPEGTRAIISAGQKRPLPERAERLAQALGQRFDGVRRFPQDVSVLGGLTNVQGRLLRGMAGATFVHLELSRGFRQELKGESAVGAFGDALLGAEVNGR